MTRHGGRILADQLEIQGIRRIFSVPGESFLAFLDGLHGSRIQNVVCRHEGGAAMMAEAHGKLTGRPGIAVVTRGPGGTNASCGVHVAMHDSTPMLLLIGQVPRDHRDREAFQEVDLRSLFRPIAKWAAEIEQTNRIPEYVARACHVAMSGRPGPVVLALPEDMLAEHADVADAEISTPPVQSVSNRDAERILERLHCATRPMVVIGGSLWSSKASEYLANFADNHGLPVVASFRRQHFLDNRHSNYVGDLSAGMNPELAALVRKSDLILSLGSRLGEISSNSYKLFGNSRYRPEIVQVHPDPTEIGRLWPASLGLAATPEALLERIVAFEPGRSGRNLNWLSECRTTYSRWQQQVQLPGAVELSKVIAWLSENLPDDAIITNGAGNYAAFLHRYFCYKQFGTQVAPTSGSMGYGLPAAIASKLEFPERLVVCLAGDGCFQMTANELSTALQHGASPIVIVANNGIYGTIRMHQEIKYPDRVSGTALRNPDFAALARAYGAHGETVVETSEFPSAFQRAVASNLPAVIELKLDSAAISTEVSLDEIREGLKLRSPE